MQKCFPQIILALFTLFFVAVIGLGVALYVFNDLEDSKVQEGVDNDIESTKPPVVTITDPPVELPVDTTTTYPTAGTPEPTAKPTSAPTMPPVTGNTTDSTMESNENATSTSTSVPVTPGPTKSPHEDNNEDNKIPLATFLTTEFGVDFTDPYSPAYLAHQWISMQDIDGLSNDQLAQRFALVALDYSLLRNFDSMQVSNWVSSESHECSWEGVTCASNIVTGVRLHSMDLPGMIPSEIGILKNLTSLDLAENQLFGTIPEALYKLTQLNEIYLYKNKLTGTISPSIGNLTALAKLHLSHNNLSGSIPETMRSDPDIKPYRYINFYSNQLTGTIPSFLRWRRLFFLDLGRNQLIGTIPEDMERFVGLRHLHLDHNQFKGSLPETFPEIGNGQLETISINDNQFTGQIPGKFEFIDKLVEFDAQNNTFNKKIDNSICSMAVLDSGAMVELKVDCNICQCQTMFCDHCL